MSKRERIEDLGRIAQQLAETCERLIDLELFLDALIPTHTDEDIREIARRLNIIHHRFENAYSIARFGDAE